LTGEMRRIQSRTSNLSHDRTKTRRSGRRQPDAEAVMSPFQTMLRAVNRVDRL
jgi:hypothetical protein